MANAHCSTYQTCIFFIIFGWTSWVRVHACCVTVCVYVREGSNPFGQIRTYTHAHVHLLFMNPTMLNACLAIACGDCKLHPVYYPLLLKSITTQFIESQMCAPLFIISVKGRIGWNIMTMTHSIIHAIVWQEKLQREQKKFTMFFIVTRLQPNVEHFNGGFHDIPVWRRSQICVVCLSDPLSTFCTHKRGVHSIEAR